MRRLGVSPKKQKDGEGDRIFSSDKNCHVMPCRKPQTPRFSVAVAGFGSFPRFLVSHLQCLVMGWLAAVCRAFFWSNFWTSVAEPSCPGINLGAAAGRRCAEPGERPCSSRASRSTLCLCVASASAPRSRAAGVGGVAVTGIRFAAAKRALGCTVTFWNDAAGGDGDHHVRGYAKGGAWAWVFVLPLLTQSLGGSWKWLEILCLERGFISQERSRCAACRVYQYAKYGSSSSFLPVFFACK